MKKTKESIYNFKTYKFTSDHTNDVKKDKIRELAREYKSYYNVLIKRYMADFYKGVKLPRFLPVINYGRLSSRCKQSCGKHVVATFESWFSNIINRCNRVIQHSNLSEEIQLQLFYINAIRGWFQSDISIKNVKISQDIIKLSRRIFKHFMFRVPVMRNVTMALDAKVAKIQKSNNSFDCWIQLSILDKGYPIYLPIQSYDYFNKVNGVSKKIVNIEVSDTTIKYGFVKDVKIEDYDGFSTIGVDVGFATLLSSSSGSQYGSKNFDYLFKKYDAIINKIVQNRMKQGLYVASPKLQRLYNKVRNLVKNEIGRCLNRMIKLEQPRTVVVENIKNITRKTKPKKKYKSKYKKERDATWRRLLGRSGFCRIGDRLKSKCKDRNIEFIEVNPAYTSQLCPVCGYVHRNNRKEQAHFKCGKCGYSRNADYVGSINIRDRRSVSAFDIYTSYKDVKEILEKEFLSRQASL